MRAFIAVVVCGILAGPPNAFGDAKADEEYVKKFLDQFPKVEPPASLDTYATAARYDELYMGAKLDAALANVTNDQGGIAWGLAYRMMSLNDVYRATGDAKYLEANLQCIRAILAATDDKAGKQLWTGTTAAAWGCDKYAQRGRAVFAVHTGIITAPMLEFVLLVRNKAEFKEAASRVVVDEIAGGVAKALAVHDRQWRDGPGQGEGHYIGLDQEDVCENKPLPGNRLSAMGWALWRSWEAGGDKTHRDRALAIGRYIKNRLTRSPDGAYYWPYWLPEKPVTAEGARESIEGEDSSHAGLTATLPFVLAASGQVFTNEDLKRFSMTVMNGIARLGGGILLSRVTGTTELTPSYVGAPTNWLPLTKVNPDVREAIVAFYLNYKPLPGPNELAKLAGLTRPN